MWHIELIKSITWYSAVRNFFPEKYIKLTKKETPPMPHKRKLVVRWCSTEHWKWNRVRGATHKAPSHPPSVQTTRKPERHPTNESWNGTAHLTNSSVRKQTEKRGYFRGKGTNSPMKSYHNLWRKRSKKKQEKSSHNRQWDQVLVFVSWPHFGAAHVWFWSVQMPKLPLFCGIWRGALGWPD